MVLAAEQTPIAPPVAPGGVEVPRARRMLRVATGRGQVRISSPGRCRLLREDPELAEVIPLARRAMAIERCIATELGIAGGSWDAEAPGARCGGGVGLLVLGGLVAVRAAIGRAYGTELLGAGDLLGCSQPDAEPLFVASVRCCVVLAPLRVAVLDRAFVERELGSCPELAVALVGRATRRAQELAARLAIISRPRVDERVHLLLWQLAGRWGRVLADGVLLPLPLTHALLAELVAARRPTVTVAMSALAQRGLVWRTKDGWMLARASDVGGPGVLHTHDHLQRPYPGCDRRRPSAVPGRSCAPDQGADRA